MTWRDTGERFSERLQGWIVPDLRYSQSVFEAVLWEHASAEYCWLDLGCGYHMLPPWRLAQEIELARRAKLLIGLDHDHASLRKHKTITNRVRGDISVLPFADESFNLVTANMVFEHLKEPRRQLAEILRILKPGGILIFHTPNVLGYPVFMARLIPSWAKDALINLVEGRKEEDIFATHYRINSVSSIRHSAAQAGFTLRETRFIMSSPVFGAFPPAALVELLFIKILMMKRFAPFRTNIIAVLERPR